MERKLVAILAADVVGYSRLMGEDETGTLERLKSLRRELVQPKIVERGHRTAQIGPEKRRKINGREIRF